MKKSIYHNAPATHRTVPKLRTSDAVRAAFDPHDHPVKPPQQSASEQQVHTQFIAMHGLRMWQSLVEYVCLFTIDPPFLTSEQLGCSCGRARRKSRTERSMPLPRCVRPAIRSAERAGRIPALQFRRTHLNYGAPGFLLGFRHRTYHYTTSLRSLHTRQRPTTSRPMDLYIHASRQHIRFS